MPITRSQAGTSRRDREEWRQIAFEDAPASPSTVVPPPPPPEGNTKSKEATAESGVVKHPPPTKEVERSDAAVAAAAVATEGARLQGPPSVRSYSSANAKIREAQLRAAEQLAEIRRREMEMERDLIRQRLQVEVDTIIEDSRASLPAEDVQQRLNEWLDRAMIEPRCRDDENMQIPTLTSEKKDAPPRISTMEERDRDMQRKEVRERDRRSPLTVIPTGSDLCEKTKDARPRDEVTMEKDLGVEKLAETLDKVLLKRPVPRYAQELPSFSGAPNEWLLFKAAMRDSTRLYNFSKEENLARLRLSLKGEAREAVSALLWSATDPEIIMRTLEQCYGRPEVLVDKALDDIRNLPRSGSTASELNTLAIKLQNIVCVIEAVDDKGYLRNPLLVREVLRKLSPHQMSNWVAYAEMHRMSTEPEVVMLSRFLMREADRELRHAYIPAASTSRNNTQSNSAVLKKSRFDKKSNVARIYVTKGQTAADNVPCLCCGGQHDVPLCQKFKAMTVDQRWDWAKNHRVCFQCVNSKHRRTRCSSRVCGVNDCKGRHHKMLHKERTASAVENVETSERTEMVASVNRSTDTTKVLLKVCPVTIEGPRGAVRTYALLDEGSTVTIVDQDLANEVGARGPVNNLRISSVNAHNESVANSENVKLKLVTKNNESFNLNAKTMKGLTLYSQGVNVECLQFAHLRNLSPKDVCYDKARPRILIGTDNWHLIVSRKLLMGKRHQPVASLTKLGWVIHGTAPQARVLLERDESVLHVHWTHGNAAREHPSTSEGEMHEMVKRYFEIDSLGIARKERENPLEVRAVKMFNENVKRIDGRCEVRLLWKRDDVEMPPSYEYALRRLKSIERKMDKCDDFKRKYTEQIDNLFEKGYAQQCDGSEPADPRSWYLPHFAVTNVNKPGKVRVVFDAAARVNGVCLNDELLEGPDLLRDLNGLLLRFRERKVAITADIREMFLQVKINENDQPAQMFLWRGAERVAPPTKYKMTSMIFGAKSSPFLAHSVRDWNAKEHAESFPQAYEAITQNHYMDDWIDSYDSISETVKVMEQVVEVHRRAGFTLTGFNSNETEVLRKLPSESRAALPKEIASSLDVCGRTLGMLWDARTDELGFNTHMARVPNDVKSLLRPPTKREALSAVMSMFDPLGLLSYYTIRAKIILQRIWRLKIEWDDALPEFEAENFMEWLSGMRLLEQLRLPRLYIHTGGAVRKELHIFCDASEAAYATAAYWRLTDENGAVYVTLASAKARVAPIKQLSIPRLELQAALIGVRLANTIIKHQRWQPERVIFWTDSQTVLHWIRNDSVRYTPYVAHRLGEIAETTEASQWRWVPTSLNVADDATRLNNEIKSVEDRWFQGPDFLYGEEGAWPKCDVIEGSTECVMFTASMEVNDSIPDARRFSRYERLVRTMARILLFINKCKGRTTELNVELLTESERLLEKESQRQCFTEEIERIEKGKNLQRGSRLRQLDPFIDEKGVLRARGRTRAAGASAPDTTPVILDGRHPYARLLLDREHRRAHHSHNERVVNDVRQRYWILRLRPSVRAVARKCDFCRVRRARPVRPVIGDLPRARLEPFVRPFTNCGLDFFGPMTVTVGRRHEKRWGALFTCLTTRAVHIELVASLSTDSAIMALRRMGARRGWPRVMYSDNATNFKGADHELRRAAEEWEPALRDFALTQRIDWRYISPGAPHQGGAWERLVRSVKNALSVTLHEKSPRDEVLSTLLAEVEHTLNARPLTHVPVSNDDPEALTPNHFLLGRSNGLPLTGPCELTSKKAWKTAQALADEYWRRWVREYLPELMPRRGARDVASRPLRVGDVVIVVDSSLPRNVWPRGVVTAVHPGPDGETRNAEVRTKGGVFRRPVSRLAVLPVEEEGFADASPGGDCDGQKSR